MFTNPGVSLVKQYNITHIIHSAAMMSRLPFLAGTLIVIIFHYDNNKNYTNIIIGTSKVSTKIKKF